MIDTIPSNDLIDINIVDISNLSVRAKNVLQKNNILSMLQLIEFAKTNNLQDLRNSGVKTTNVKDVIEAGADLIVSGSDVFADKENRIRAYKEIFKNYKK